MLKIQNSVLNLTIGFSNWVGILVLLCERINWFLILKIISSIYLVRFFLNYVNFQRDLFECCLLKVRKVLISSYYRVFSIYVKLSRYFLLITREWNGPVIFHLSSIYYSGSKFRSVKSWAFGWKKNCMRKSMTETFSWRSFYRMPHCLLNTTLTLDALV